MGYRLEISKLKYSDCGGKLFGYLSTKDLHKCKSWQWLKDNEYLDKKTENKWDYGYTHGIVLSHDDYLEFLKLYIEDFNTFYNYCKLSLDDFKDSLSADDVYIEWG